MGQTAVSIEILREPQPGAGEGIEPSVEQRQVTPATTGQAAIDAVEAWIRPYNPSRTGEKCVYAFDSAEHGRGVIRVGIDGTIFRARMDDRVQLLEIERELGRRRPDQLFNSVFWNYCMRLQVRSPYLQILFGLLMLVALGLPTLARALDGGLRDASSWIEFVAGMIVTLLACYLWLYRGVRRLGWWHSARGVAKRSGERLPEDLRFIA